MKKLLVLLATTAMLFSFVAFSQVLDDTAVNLSFTGRLNEAKATAMTSADTVYIAYANGNLVHISGATDISSFGPAQQAGIKRTLIFDSVIDIFHNASTLVIPGNTTLTTAVGDSAVVISDSTTKWIIQQYTRRATAP